MSDRPDTDQPAPERGAVDSTTDVRETVHLRRYGRLRAAIKRRQDRFEGYRRRLNQARIGVPVDLYLTRTVAVAGRTALVTAAIGLAIGLIWWYRGGIGWPYAVGIGVVIGILGGGIVGGWRLGRPVLNARRRRARIDYLLPYGVAYLYALSQGGVSLFEAIRALADARAEYGALAAEFETAINDIDHLGAAPIGALEALKDRTASDALASFLEGLIGTVESGGNVTRYLESQSEEFYREVEREQSAFLEEVALYAELYVGLLVVAPIFAVIVLVVVGVIGGSGAILPLAAVIYGGVPLLTAGFLWVTAGLSRAPTAVAHEHADSGRLPVPESVANDERLDRYLRHRTPGRLAALRERPVAWLRGRPIRVLFVSAPVAIGVVIGGAATGLLTPPAWTTQPVVTTASYVVLPVTITLGPFAMRYERTVRRDRARGRALPDLLEQLSGANRQGLTLAEGLELTAKRATGALSTELERAANDVRWGAAVGEAFDRLRRRLRLASGDRTIALLTDASRYSSNLYRAIDIAAQDAQREHELAADRRSETQSYVVIVLISFGLYLFMLVVIDRFFLAQLAVLPEVEVTAGVFGQALNATIDRSQYRLLLLHAALVQGFGAGLVAGELGEGSWASGLKYSLASILVATGVFALFV